MTLIQHFNELNILFSNMIGSKLAQLSQKKGKSMPKGKKYPKGKKK